MAKKEANAKDSKNEGEGSAPPQASRSGLFSTLLILLNTLAILAAAGTFFYTQMMFKRPSITESQERQRIHKEIQATETPDPNAQPGEIKIDPFTANVSPSKLPPGVTATQQVKGQAHFLTVGFIMIIRDAAQMEEFNKIRPKFMDQILQMLGKKSYQELNSVQGRYVLRSSFVDLANDLMQKPLIKSLWFTDFVVQ